MTNFFEIYNFKTFIAGLKVKVSKADDEYPISFKLNSLIKLFIGLCIIGAIFSVLTVLTPTAVPLMELVSGRGFYLLTLILFGIIVVAVPIRILYISLKYIKNTCELGYHELNSN